MNSRRLMLAPAHDRASYRQKLAHWKGHQCPLWVTSGRWRRNKSCPLYPRKRHQTRHVQMPAPLALLDSIEITRQRTAAATAVATQYLARPDSRTATICGCGEQGRIQLRALRHKLELSQIFAWDIDPETSRRFAAEMAAELGIDVTAIDHLREGTLVSDAIVTCTSSRSPFLGLADVRPGTFVAAVGADNPEKSEIKPELMAKAAVIVDVLQQSIVMGDMHHAIKAAVMTPSDVRAELGTLIAERRPGRLADEEITIFDSSGTGVQDVAAAARAYELARDRGIGLVCALA
jgi:alanine dehydrogenase